MAPTESQIKAAQDELLKDKREWFCLECARPRQKRYCPWNAKHANQQPHLVMLRHRITFRDQVNLFLSNKQGESTRHVFKDG